MEVLETSEAARLLGCSAENVRALERAGKLPAMRTRGGRRLFTLADVERLAAEREEKKRRGQALTGGREATTRAAAGTMS